MADIFHYFPINASPEKVFESVSSPEGLNKWWSKDSKGTMGIGEFYELFFGANYHWIAVVSKYEPYSAFELTITKADDDWTDNIVGFRLTHKNDFTQVEFYNTGWKEPNEHYRITNYCWAMYLRILKRFIENNEQVPYEERLNV